MILSLLIIPALHVTLIGALGGLVGAFAYLDRRIFFAESVTHGTFPGAVLGVVVASGLGLGHSGMSAALYVGAFLGTLPLVALMRRLASIPGISSQGAAGIVLTAGFAAGYFLATWFKPLPLAVSSFLTGSVMTVSPADVAWAGAVLLLAVGVVAAGHRQLLAHCFDPADPAAARGASRDERIILGLILAAVTVAIPAVGTILSIALIAAPAAALAPLVRSSRAFLIGCPLLGDGKYGTNELNRPYGETGQALYAYSLTFRFAQDAGALQYLNGKTFKVKDIPFVKKYFPNFKP